MGSAVADFFVSHADDASFRQWMRDIDALIIASGLIPTSDTGQIDFNTAVKPGTSVTAGFRFYAFNDTMQAQKPIVLRVGFGTGGAAQYASINFSIFNGTDGNGNGISLYQGTGITQNDTNQLSTKKSNSYAYHEDGVFWMAVSDGVQTGAGGNLFGSLAIMRTCDVSGATNNKGFAMCAGNAGSPYSMYMQNVNNSAMSGEAVGLPLGATQGDLGQDVQLWNTYTVQPMITINPYMLLAASSLFSSGSEIVVSPAPGHQQKNYIIVGKSFGGNITGSSGKIIYPSIAIAIFLPWDGA